MPPHIPHMRHHCIDYHWCKNGVALVPDRLWHTDITRGAVAEQSGEEGRIIPSPSSRAERSLRQRGRLSCLSEQMWHYTHFSLYPLSAAEPGAVCLISRGEPFVPSLTSRMHHVGGLQCVIMAPDMKYLPRPAVIAFCSGGLIKLARRWRCRWLNIVMCIYMPFKGQSAMNQSVCSVCLSLNPN